MKIVDNLLVLPICIQPAFKSVSTVSHVIHVERDTVGLFLNYSTGDVV